MKTNALKNNRVLIICIYALAFILMTFTFNAQAADAKKEDSKKANAVKTEKYPSVVIETSMGKIIVKLNEEKAPITTENFLKYVEKKHFDGTIFHRVIDNFMIQGGGYTADTTEKEVMAPIQLESNKELFNKRGTIAMARTGEPNSATAQFFINVKDNAFLDYQSAGNPGYAVFGEVTSGMDVVDKIKKVKTAKKEFKKEGPMDDVPVETVTIKSIRKGTK